MMRNFSKYEHQKPFSEEANSFSLGSANSEKLEGNADSRQARAKADLIL